MPLEATVDVIDAESGDVTSPRCRRGDGARRTKSKDAATPFWADLRRGRATGNSYWFGATSRWRVRSGMPRRKHWAWISCMHAKAAVACDGAAM